MNVLIDFTKNNINCGHENENLSTTIDIAVPEPMLVGISQYKAVFQVYKGVQYKSDFLTIDDNNHITYQLPKEVTWQSSVGMQLIGYGDNGEETRTDLITLVFGKSVFGKELIVDPFVGQVKVLGLKLLDNGKVNISSTKLIEYVKQNILILFGDSELNSSSVLSVLTYDETFQLITLYYVSQNDNGISGISFITINHNCDYNIVTKRLVVENIYYDEETSVKEKIDDIYTKLTMMSEEIQWLREQIENNNQSN